MSSDSGSLLLALAGNPNCGKTALFNALTGGKSRVGNYPGVTVEKKEGSVVTPSGVHLRVYDLPGAYSLNARTPDEAITRDVLTGMIQGEQTPHVLLAVADATQLERNLAFILELLELQIPVLLALNMMDLAKARGQEMDLDALSRELGIPVVPTVAVRGEGVRELLDQSIRAAGTRPLALVTYGAELSPAEKTRKRFQRVDQILRACTRQPLKPLLWNDRIDRLVLHPLWGMMILVGFLVLIFQAIFSWAGTLQDLIEAGVNGLGSWVTSPLAEGPLKDLLLQGVFAGVGGVLVFLPQILILFFFILLLEDSGYMARAAFLMDRVMGKVGLHGRAFIPLLSSYACAIPGIMATRTIENRRDRLATILVAPLTTCSARLPVYTLLIAAFIPDLTVWGPLRLQGLVMFGLYAMGLIMALLMAAIFKRTLLKDPKPPLLLELPTYKWPSMKNLWIGLKDRAGVFLKRAGTVILSISIVLWFLASYPKRPEGATEPAIHYSYAGKLGHAVEPWVKPIGFDWRMGIALIPGFAAREVMVSALATVYAIENEDEEQQTQALSSLLGQQWSLATGLSLMVWYVVALQCLATFAVIRRETNSWRWPFFALGYLTLLAYAGSFLTYQAARWLGGGA